MLISHRWTKNANIESFYANTFYVREKNGNRLIFFLSVWIRLGLSIFAYTQFFLVSSQVLEIYQVSRWIIQNKIILMDFNVSMKGRTKLCELMRSNTCMTVGKFLHLTPNANQIYAKYIDDLVPYWVSKVDKSKLFTYIFPFIPVNFMHLNWYRFIPVILFCYRIPFQSSLFD